MDYLKGKPKANLIARNIINPPHSFVVIAEVINLLDIPMNESYEWVNGGNT